MRDGVHTDYSRLAGTASGGPRVRTLRAAVLGAGALGNQVVEMLGRLGARHVLIADPDSVEASNLTRSTLFRQPGSIGRNKAVALAEAASHCFPDTAFTAVGRELADVGFASFAGADVLFGCLDNDWARLELAYIGTKLDRPVCDAGIAVAGGARGRVSWFPGREAPCYSCRLRGATRRRLLETWDGPRYRCDDATTGEDGEIRPSTPAAAAIAGALQVEVALHSLEAEAHDACSIEFSLGAPWSMEEIRVTGAERCPFHEEPGELAALPQDDATFESLLLQAGLEGGEPRIALDWPICVAARCEDCVLDWQPMMRASALRRSSRCPRCASQYIRCVETLRFVPPGSPWSSRRPSELGLPAGHLYTIERRPRP